MILSVETDAISLDAKLLVIGLRTPGDVKLWKLWDYADEQAMLNAFVDHFLGIQGDKIIIGYNILKFDVPLLLRKTAAHARFAELFQRINSSNVIDLFTILTFLNEGQLKSMDFYCERFSIPSLGPKRDEVAMLVKSDTPESKERISTLVSLKLNVINDLFLKSWGRVRDGSFKPWERQGGSP